MGGEWKGYWGTGGALRASRRLNWAEPEAFRWRISVNAAGSVIQPEATISSAPS